RIVEDGGRPLEDRRYAAEVAAHAAPQGVDAAQADDQERDADRGRDQANRAIADQQPADGPQRERTLERPRREDGHAGTSQAGPSRRSHRPIRRRFRATSAYATSIPQRTGGIRSSTRATPPPGSSRRIARALAPPVDTRPVPSSTTCSAASSGNPATALATVGLVFALTSWSGTRSSRCRRSQRRRRRAVAVQMPQSRS